MYTKLIELHKRKAIFDKTEGKLSYNPENNRLYFCSNNSILKGAPALDYLGYRYSWVLFANPKNHSNLIICDSKNKYNRKIILTQ